MRDLNRVKRLAGILNEEMDKGDMHDALGDALTAMANANYSVRAVSNEIEKTLYTDESVEDVADRQTLQKLAGIEEDMADGEITKDSVKKSALELLVDIAKTSKQYKGEITDDQVHYLGSLVHDFDMAGIETEKYSEIEKLFRTMADTERAEMSMIQPAYAQAKALDVAEESVQEAVGDSAECFYDMQDEFAGEEASGAHKILIDELVRYLSGDQLEDFCDDFKRHHMEG